MRFKSNKKKDMKKLLCVALMLIAAVSAVVAKDIKTLVVTTDPEMHCQSCEKRIKNYFKFEKGIKKIETSLEHQAVKLTYDADKTTKEKLLKGFAELEFDVKEIADPFSSKKGK